MASHKQALANHVCVCSSLKAMTTSVHEAEVFLNAAPIVVDPDDQGVRKTCLPDDDTRVEAIGESKRETEMKRERERPRERERKRERYEKRERERER